MIYGYQSVYYHVPNKRSDVIYFLVILTGGCRRQKWLFHWNKEVLIMVLKKGSLWETVLRTLFENPFENLFENILRTFWEPFSCNFHHQKGSQLLKKVLLKVLKKVLSGRQFWGPYVIKKLYWEPFWEPFCEP